MRKLIQSKWQSMPENNRRISALLGVIVILALLYVGIWQPSVNARSKLSVKIQEKKSQLAQMQMQVAQIQSLRSAISLSHSSNHGLQTAIETSAKLHHLDGRISKIEVQHSGGVHIVIPSVSFDEWVAWAYALQTEHQIRVASMQAQALSVGLVSVDANLVAVE